VLRRLLIRLVVLAVAIFLTAWLIPGITVKGGFLTYLWIALIFAVVNLIVGPLLTLISLPLLILTLGLFSLILNTALLGITAWISDDLNIDGFWPAFFGALLIAVIAALLQALIPDPKRHQHAA